MFKNREKEYQITSRKYVSPVVQSTLDRSNPDEEVFGRVLPFQGGLMPKSDNINSLVNFAPAKQIGTL